MTVSVLRNVKRLFRKNMVKKWMRLLQNVRGNLEENFLKSKNPNNNASVEGKGDSKNSHGEPYHHSTDFSQNVLHTHTHTHTHRHNSDNGF